MDFSLIAEDLAFPEGPVALDDGTVLLVEIAGERLVHIGRTGRIREVAALPGGPNGLALGPGGTYGYVCNHGGTMFSKEQGGWRPGPPPPHYKGGRIERIHIDTGKVELLYDRTDDGRLNGPNDLVFDTHGGFYFTDMGKTHARHIDRGAVYYAAADGSRISKIVDGLLTPNGIGLSPDQSRLYIAETQTSRLWSWPISAPGKLERSDTMAAHGGIFLAGSADYQMFDSLAVEASGNICVATLLNGGITVISPDGGVIRHLPTGDHYTTNLCFGGKDLQTAYITLSRSGRLVAAPWPRPGLRLNHPARGA